MTLWAASNVTDLEIWGPFAISRNLEVLFVTEQAELVEYRQFDNTAKLQKEEEGS